MRHLDLASSQCPCRVLSLICCVGEFSVSLCFTGGQSRWSAMSGDPNHGFGQYSAAAATTQWNWAQMLANSTASSPVASIQAAVAAQRASFHPHHHHPNPNVLYSQAGPNAAMPPSPWTQHWGGSWPHQNGQSNRVPSSFSVQSHAAIAGLQQQQQPQQQHQHPGPSAQSTQNAFKCRRIVCLMHTHPSLVDLIVCRVIAILSMIIILHSCCHG